MIRIEDLLEKIKSYNHDEKDMIQKAYYYAEYMHNNQTRESGEPYITHPLSVAYILAEMNADKDTICAALLHDILEDTESTKEEITDLFNSDIANLVDGVTKLKKMNFSSKQEQNLANTRKIITSVRNDVRIIIIKLADRLHNMRTLEHKSEFKQKENAIETMEIFVPFAYNIGAYRLKSELEDWSLRYLEPDKYKMIQDLLQKDNITNNLCLKEMLFTLKVMLADENIPNTIKTRTKNIYGIYKNMENGKTLNDIHDLLSLKIIVEDLKQCYYTLGLVHDKYIPINSKFKDYICNPKTNMYQSLHTTVFGPKDKLVQTQIRTFNMDKIASFGLTEYWNINKDNARIKMQEELKNKYQFYKSLEEIDDKFKDNNLFLEQAKNKLFGNKIYVYNSEGKPIELPKGSTTLDFANKNDSQIKNIVPYVNEKEVSENYELKNKDRVLIYHK